jgi:hypothetical protein
LAGSIAKAITAATQPNTIAASASPTVAAIRVTVDGTVASPGAR